MEFQLRLVYEGNVTFDKNGIPKSCEKVTHTKDGTTRVYEGNVTFHENGRPKSWNQLTHKKGGDSISVGWDTYIRNGHAILNLIRIL